MAVLKLLLLYDMYADLDFSCTKILYSFLFVVNRSENFAEERHLGSMIDGGILLFQYSFKLKSHRNDFLISICIQNFTVQSEFKCIYF